MVIPPCLNPKPLRVAFLSLPLFPVPRSSRFCSLLFVFGAGSGFSYSFSWNHDSILYIKARIQLKLCIREQSRVLTAPCCRKVDATQRGQLLLQPLLTAVTHVRQQLLVPLQALGSRAFPAGRRPAHPGEMGVCRQNSLSSSGTWSSVLQWFPEF